MLYLYKANEIREREKDTIYRVGLPSLVLMERAALSMMPFLKELKEGAKILLACGTGNNGGDGLALARLLWERGYNVTICYPGKEERASSENRTQLNIIRELAIPILPSIPDEHYAVIVDCLFGIGLNRDIEEPYLSVIEDINEKCKLYKTVVLSADIPSGLNSDTGKIMGVCVKATGTISFGYGKIGCYIADGPKYSGHVAVRKIGILPGDFPKAKAYLYTPEDLKDILSKRPVYGNKGTFGKVLCICGSDTMGGAALLAAKAALKSGAGMVKILSSERNRDFILQSLPEAMFGFCTEEEILKSLDWCTSCVIGPGLSQEEESERVVRYTLKNCSSPVVVDADAINILQNDHEPIVCRKDKGYVSVLTPHPGEFSKYFNESIRHKRYKDPEIIKERAAKEGVILVAKDARTIVSDGNRIYVNQSGNDAMATAGSGDVLAGIIGSMLGVMSDPMDAVTTAVFLHGLGGERAALDKGNRYSVVASNIIKGMELTLGDLCRDNPSAFSIF